MKKILYVHGLLGKANGNSSRMIRKELENRNLDFEVIAPEIIFDSVKSARRQILKYAADCDLIIASSLGAFCTMLTSGDKKILINPAMPENIEDNNLMDDENFISEMYKYRDRFFEDWIDNEIRSETKVILGTEDVIAPNSKIIKDNFYSKNIYELDMEHRLSEEGAKLVVDIIENNF